jgi:tetratricopeptide (TPR) repeat protein
MGKYFGWKAKEYHRALEQYNQGLTMGSGNADLLQGATASEMSLSRWDQVLSHVEQARSIDPRSFRAAYRRAIVLLWMRRYSESRDAVDDALAIAPAHTEAIELKMMTYLAQGDLATARAFSYGRPSETEAANQA